MGLISFAKNAGKRLLHRDDDDQQEAQAQSQPAEAPSAEAAASVEPSVTAAVAEAAPVAVEPAPAPVETSAPAAASNEGVTSGSGADRTYTSRAGDTLEAIAAYFYGDPVHSRRLLEENPSLAQHSGSLPGGVQMRVPADAAPAEAAALSSEYFGGSPEAQSRAVAQLTEQVTSLGIPVDNLAISLNGDVATVTGMAATQADREKVVLAIGNTSGIAQVDDQMDVQEPAPEAVFYTVQSGDTLSAIAAAQYGDASKYMQIFEANQPMLENPDLIYPGQSLRIPPL